MATTEEIMLLLTVKDNASGTLKGINGFLTTSVGSAITNVTSRMLGFAKDSIDAAMTAENEWNRFGAAVNATGGNWDQNSDKIKGWVKNFSNNMGRAVGDTRAAMTAYMNYGLSMEESQKAMEATAGLAAATGSTQEEAANKLTRAFAGQGRGLKTLGINIKDYKDETTGAIDKTKLLNDIMAKTGGAADKYANSTQAKAQKVQNQLATLKTDFGQQLLVALEPLLPVLQQFLQTINNLPQPIKAVGVAFGGIVAGAGLVSGPLLSMIGIFQQLTGVFGNLGGGKEGGSGGSALGKVKQRITSTVRDAEKIGTMAPEAAAAGAAEEATAVSMSSIATGAMSLLAPLLEIAIVVAVMIPIIAALAAEALIFIKGIQILIKSLSFDSIDLSGAIDGITQVAHALVMVVAAMGAMTVAGLSTAIANVMSLGMIVPSIALALEEIKAVARELIKLNTIPTVDLSGTIKLIRFKSAIASVDSAVKSMASLSWNVMSSNFMMLGGLLGSFSSNIGSAINDIKIASQKISQIKSLPNIDTSVTEKLKQTSEALAKVAEAIGSLRKVNDAQVTWNPLTNFGNALTSAKSDLEKAATTLRQFNGANFQIPEGIGSKITTLADALKPIATAIGSLASINNAQQNWNPMTNFIEALKSAKKDLQNAALTLWGFTIVPVPEGIGGKITNLANALKTIKTAIDVLKTINDAQSSWNPMTNFIESLKSAKKDLVHAAQTLQSLSAIPQVPEGTATKILNVANALKPLKQAVDSINQNPIPQVTGGGGNIDLAVQKVKNIAKSLNGLQGTTVNAGGALQSIRNAINQIKTVLNTGVGGVSASATNVGRAIGNGLRNGMVNLGGQLRGVVSSAMGQVRSVAVTQSSQAGTQASTAFRNGFKLAQTVQTEMQHVLTAISNKKSQIVDAIRNLANDAKTTFVLELEVQSPGLMARTMGAEMGYIQQSVVGRAGNVISAVRDMARGIVEAFGNPSLAIADDFNSLSRFVPSSFLTMGAITQQNTPMVNGANNIIININDGAVQLDARNLTTHECKQIMINALENLDQIKNIDIRGY